MSDVRDNPYEAPKADLNAVPAQPGGHQEDGGPHALAAARLDVLADFRDQIDLRLNVARKFAVDLCEVGPNRFEDLRQGRRRLFHSGFR